ncbi:hypothetical protein EKM02_11755 [Flavobacterium sp. RSP49]|uniref:hypothetical protein n=1 Tax=Flavobacterium sp. RSP49 TaxID=2497487 RepID=UPI000F827E0F|nr:hypothetical protein [Flavobacterium sp. RSP49]RTY98485.1 hypothetical protein EKM02_11755 [Flavobacterium sp. RSP49]
MRSCKRKNSSYAKPLLASHVISDLVTIPSTLVTLQSNSKRPIETTSQELLPKSSSGQGTGSHSQSPSNPIPRATINGGQSSTGQGELFSTNAGILEI